MMVLVFFVGYLLLKDKGKEAKQFWNHYILRQPGSCPLGQYNYGGPLGCVSNSYQCEGINCPKCLSKQTLIDSPKGAKQAAEIKIGDLVWSKNENGEKISVPVIKISKRDVTNKASLLKVTLSDSRNIIVSPNHPTADHTLFKNLQIGQALDNAKIVKMEVILYTDQFTYDLLPDSSTGFYWANGILVGSTLKK